VLAACRAIQLFAVDSWGEDTAREVGCVPPLVALLADTAASWPAWEAAARALHNLSCDNARNQEAVRLAGGLRRLVQLAEDPRASAGARDAFR
jgi:hypothetical protein